MKKVFYYGMIVLMIVSFIGFIHALITGSSTVIHTMFMSIIAGLMAMLLEPNITVQQENKIFGILLLVMGSIIVIIMMSSCTTTGYGCHGNSKIITRVR